MRKYTAQGEVQAFLHKVKCWNFDKCLVWPYNSGKLGIPVYMERKKGRVVRRVVLEDFLKYPPPFKKSLATTTCGTFNCVAPKHLYWYVAKARAKKFGVVKLSGKENGKSTISKETVELIFNAKGSCKKVGAAFGVSHGVVNNIKNKKHWSQRNDN